MSEKLKGGLMERAVIRRLILDLGSENPLYVTDAARFLDRPEFLEICERLGYPPELLDTLHGVVQQSKVERKITVQKVLDILKIEWDE